MLPAVRLVRFLFVRPEKERAMREIQEASPAEKHTELGLMNALVEVVVALLLRTIVEHERTDGS